MTTATSTTATTMMTWVRRASPRLRFHSQQPEQPHQPQQGQLMLLSSDDETGVFEDDDDDDDHDMEIRRART